MVYNNNKNEYLPVHNTEIVTCKTDVPVYQYQYMYIYF